MFSLYLFSKYRSELMGIATILIIVCHAPQYGVTMPQWIKTIISNGGFGVDIFLFLSGMGMYNSYKFNNIKKKGLLYWYLKRYLRIIIPYILIVAPILFWNPWNIERFFLPTIIELSGFGSIVGHGSLWFISCILILYLITPLLFIPLESKNKWLWTILFSIISLLYAYLPPITNIWHFMLQRWPSFFLGFALSQDIKERHTALIKVFFILPLILYIVLYISNHVLETHFSLFLFQGISMLTLFTLILDKIKNIHLNAFLSFIGTISLESYITNEYVLRALTTFSWQINGYNINSGNWTLYLGGTIICIAISYIVNKISIKLNQLLQIN